jgi:two-component system LytT family response regulator
MHRVIIIDDEPLARGLVAEYLQEHPDFTVLQECGDGFEGMKAIQQHRPDLIFLDIQMPKINGFEMLELIEDPPGVIFTTAFDEYAMKAFDTHAVDYLLKPFSQERFDQALEKWKVLHQAKAATMPPSTLLESTHLSAQQKERIVVKSGTKIIIIPVEDIHYLEAADDFVKVHTANGSWLKNRTLSHFEKLLDPQQFVRTHRSYIVNITGITRLEPYEKENYLAILRTGQKVPVSKTGYPRLKEALGL